MYVSITGNKGNQDVYIKQSYRKENGKTSSRIYKKLGKYNDLLTQFSGDETKMMDWAKEEAEKWINAHNTPKDKQYKGYDGKYYPYYVKIPINSISLNDTWNVSVYDKEYMNCAYIVNNIIAISEEEAIFKAKKFVASNGYFTGLDIKQAMDMLKVEKVEKVEDSEKG